MVRPLLLSLLVRQSLALGERFRTRYPHAWLVWEAGVWHVPEQAEQDVAKTQLSAPDLQDCLPSGEDALCFELHGGAWGRAFTLGRASTNDLVVNDSTVSRELLVFTPAGKDGWRVALAPQGHTVTLNGKPLVAGEQTQLGPVGELLMGEVRLTFLGEYTKFDNYTGGNAIFDNE